MFRFKAIFGGNLNSRELENQAVELFIKCAALNRMIQIAKPDIAVPCSAKYRLIPENLI